MSDQIRFTDGAAYEQYMGRWSQFVGTAFLEWLAPAAGLRWLDVGCGNGVFTEMVAERCKPGSIAGIDPSEAHRRPLRYGGFVLGIAMTVQASHCSASQDV